MIITCFAGSRQSGKSTLMQELWLEDIENGINSAIFFQVRRPYERFAIKYPAYRGQIFFTNPMSMMGADWRQFQKAYIDNFEMMDRREYEIIFSPLTEQVQEVHIGIDISVFIRRLKPTHTNLPYLNRID